MAATTEYFRVLADPSATDRWFLDEPTTSSSEAIDSRRFIEGTTYTGPLPAQVPVSGKGSCRAFNFAAFDMPVVSRDVAAVLEKHASDSVQLFSVRVGDEDESYYVLNITKAIECVDDEKSEVMKWTPADGRPDKIGQYRMITKLAVQPTSIGPQKVLRIKGWEIALVVSRDVRDALVRIPNLGVVFQPIS